MYNMMMRQNNHTRLSIRTIIALCLCLTQGCSEDPVAREIQRLRDGDENIRKAAAETLGESNDPRAIKPLIAALGDRASDIRSVAEQALIKLCNSEKELSNITLADYNWRLFDLTLRPFITRPAFIDGLVAETAITELLTTLRTNPELSRAAAMALARTSHPRMIELFATILKNNALSAVRIAAAEALGEIIASDSVEPFVFAINDSSEAARSTAVTTLGNIGDDWAVEPLIAALNDNNENVREAVIEALGKIKDPRAVHPLIACLKDSAPQRVQEAAIQALAQMREIVIETLIADGSSAVEPLLVLAMSPNGDLRESSLKALAKMDIERALTNSIAMKLVYISPGEFTMGSPTPEKHRDSDEGPQHRVRISKGFLMAETEVTQTQYQAVMGMNPSHFKASVDLPVENVSWHDAVEFCRRLSEKEGRSYRLPTEAEWEYACRAGTNTIFCFGNSLDANIANFNGNYPNSKGHKGLYHQKTVTVKTYKPNVWGLYDMHGNVYEWCSDWYGENYYSSSPSVNPKGPSIGQFRIVRGGAWINLPEYCRSANRSWNAPDNRYLTIGFRIVLALN